MVVRLGGLQLFHWCRENGRWEVVDKGVKVDVILSTVTCRWKYPAIGGYLQETSTNQGIFKHTKNEFVLLLPNKCNLYLAVKQGLL